MSQIWHMPTVAQSKIQTTGYRVPMSTPATLPPFAKLLRERREELGLRQEDVADAAGLSRRTYGRWETGEVERPKSKPLKAVCAVLGIKVIDAEIALGSIDELEGSIDPQIEELIAALRSPRLSADVKEAVIVVLRNLLNRADPPANGKRAS